jgi:hypothetical protein
LPTRSKKSWAAAAAADDDAAEAAAAAKAATEAAAKAAAASTPATTASKTYASIVAATTASAAVATASVADVDVDDYEDYDDDDVLNVTLIDVEGPFGSEISQFARDIAESLRDRNFTVYDYKGDLSEAEEESKDHPVFVVVYNVAHLINNLLYDLPDRSDPEATINFYGSHIRINQWNRTKITPGFFVLKPLQNILQLQQYYAWTLQQHLLTVGPTENLHDAVGKHAGSFKKHFRDYQSLIKFVEPKDFDNVESIVEQISPQADRYKSHFSRLFRGEIDYWTSRVSKRFE